MLITKDLNYRKPVERRAGDQNKSDGSVLRFSAIDKAPRYPAGATNRREAPWLLLGLTWLVGSAL
jgi:hypothetical protein